MIICTNKSYLHDKKMNLDDKRVEPAIPPNADKKRPGSEALTGPDDNEV